MKFKDEIGEEFELADVDWAKALKPGLLVIRPVVKAEPKSSDCWLWAGFIDEKGYGVLHYTLDKKQRGYRAHRVMYELANGPIPKGLVIDHLCRTPRCINPDHLEAVTQTENVRRGKLGVLYEQPKYCKNGHEITEENSFVRVSKTIGNVYRRCNICMREYYRNKDAERRAKRRTALQKENS